MTGLGRVLIYTKRLPEMVAFYTTHFEFDEVRRETDRIVELVPRTSGAHLLLHSAAKGQREGQAQVKLVFDVADVVAFAAKAKERGLLFGPIHDGGGYAFANAKDPSGNSIQISSRATRSDP